VEDTRGGVRLYRFARAVTREVWLCSEPGRREVPATQVNHTRARQGRKAPGVWVPVRLLTGSTSTYPVSAEVWKDAEDE
jgi:hypothetical protein